MKVRRRYPFVIPLAALAALTACRRHPAAGHGADELVGTTSLTGAIVYVPSDIAREQVAQARCEHAMKCEAIPYEELSECIERGQAELAPRVGPKACRSGVDEHALRECLDWTAHRADCGSPDDQAKREALCAPAKLCSLP